jgi:hypothetical protein
MRTRTLRLLLASALVLTALPLAASTIKEVKLADGRESANTIGSPIFDASKVGALRIGAIEAAYDKKAKLVRKTGGMMTKGPQYDLDPGVDLGAILTESLRTEAPAMGFKLTQGDDFAWEVKGALKDVYLESRQVPYGATQFWGYMDVEFAVQKKGGEARTERLRAHKAYSAYSAGMGRKDEATEGLTQLLVEGAQDLLARLNRLDFKAPPAAEMEKKAKALTAAKDKHNDLHLVALSGTTAAVPVLMTLIPATSDENDRARLIEAVARVGSAEPVSSLASRYAKEDEDCRWETLKAMDYIGGDEAKAVVTQGLKDSNEACRRLAARILGTAKP